MKLTDQQRAFVESNSDVCAFVGGRVSGKTVALLRRAITVAERGDDVVVVAPRLDMTRNINDRVIDTIESQMPNVQISVKRKDEIRFRNGSTIYFPKKITKTMDVEQICVDELQLHDKSSIKDIKSHARKWGTTLHATGNTDSTEHIDPTAVVFSRTADNPANSHRHRQIVKPSLEPFDRKQEVGDHVVSMDTMECILCGNEEGTNTPDNMSPARERTLRVWILSKFKGVDCVNRLA